MMSPPTKTLKDWERITDKAMGKKGKDMTDRLADAIYKAGSKLYHFFKGK